MDLDLPNLRDRRIAASDEFRSVAGTSIYASAAGVSRARRSTRIIRSIILHQTDGATFIKGGTGPLPPGIAGRDAGSDSNIRSNHRIDKITAHFVILNNGLIFYTRDVEYILQSVSGRLGIDIEFAGSFQNRRDLRQAAIISGRSLIKTLKVKLPNLTHIHPHGQIQRYNGNRNNLCSGTTCNKYESCPGPDVWVNVGEYAVRHFGLISHSTVGRYQNNGISPVQSDPSYDQGII